MGVIQINFDTGLEDARIIKRRGHYADDAFFRTLGSSKTGAALRAEAAKVLPAFVTLGGVFLDLTMSQSKGGEGKDDRRSIRTSADLLTVAAVALQHEDGSSRAFKADSSAEAASSDGQIHSGERDKGWVRFSAQG